MSKTDKKDHMLNSTMSLGDHLEDLRKRLMYALGGLVAGAIVGFCFSRQIIIFIEGPYLEVMGDVRLQTLAPAEGFISFIKIAFVTGLILSSPWVFYQLWMFIAAGLYPHEKKYVHLAAPFSAVLFVAGAMFFILIVAPLTLRFLVKFNSSFLGADSRFTFPYYISFITHLMLVFGVAFQTPTAIFFLNRTGLVSMRSLVNARKYILLVVFIVAAMATPPDPVSQVTLAVPLYLLFELGILLSYFAERKNALQKTE